MESVPLLKCLISSYKSLFFPIFVSGFSLQFKVNNPVWLKFSCGRLDILIIVESLKCLKKDKLNPIKL